MATVPVDDLGSLRRQAQRSLDERFPRGVWFEVYYAQNLKRKALIRSGPSGRVFVSDLVMRSGEVPNLLALVFCARTRFSDQAYLSDSTRPFQCWWDGSLEEVDFSGSTAWRFFPLSDAGLPWPGMEVFVFDGADPVREVPEEARAVCSHEFEALFFPEGL